MANLVSVAVVGALLGETIILVKETITTTEMFQTRLRSILDRLDTLKPQFDKMIRYKCNDEMDRPDEELIPIYDLLISCQHLVETCKKIKKWQLYEKHQCLKQLEDLDNQIVGYCSSNLIAIIAGDMKEANAAISELKDEIMAGVNRLHLLVDVPLKNIKDEVLDGSDSDPVNVVESSAGGGCEMNKLSLDEQVTAISYEYDVFLSFRGFDTRESFTSTLFYALNRVYKVKTFMDVIFKKGSKLEDLLKMVEKSRISIVVFSENFAESEWCLKELAKIFEESNRRKHEVVPVFFKVSPSELRKQDCGKTKEHMEKHYNTYGKDSDTVKSWSNAIKELGGSTGYTYWSGRGKQEIDLAEEIIQDILNRIQS